MQSSFEGFSNEQESNQGIIEKVRRLYVEHEKEIGILLAELGILFMVLYANIYYVKF